MVVVTVSGLPAGFWDTGYFAASPCSRSDCVTSAGRACLANPHRRLCGEWVVGADHGGDLTDASAVGCCGQAPARLGHPLPRISARRHSRALLERRALPRTLGRAEVDHVAIRATIGEEACHCIGEKRFGAGALPGEDPLELRLVIAVGTRRAACGSGAWPKKAAVDAPTAVMGRAPPGTSSA